MKLYKIVLGIMLTLLGVSCSDGDDFSLPVINPEVTGTFTDDRDGTEYHWVRIGGLDWMTENSRYDVNDVTKCCFYVDYAHSGETAPIDKFSEKYGFLYTLQGALEAVPEGWRLPSDDDWKKLEQALGMSKTEVDALDWRGTITGELMKQADEGTMLGIQMAGYYTPYMIMVTPKWRFIGTYGFYWTSTMDENKIGEYYFYRKLYYNSSQVYRQSMEPNAQMLSVRFVRDAK